jgi:hypothetical protein
VVNMGDDGDILDVLHGWLLRSENERAKVRNLASWITKRKLYSHFFNAATPNPAKFIIAKAIAVKGSPS